MYILFLTLDTKKHPSQCKQMYIHEYEYYSRYQQTNANICTSINSAIHIRGDKNPNITTKTTKKNTRQKGMQIRRRTRILMLVNMDIHSDANTAVNTITNNPRYIDSTMISTIMEILMLILMPTRKSVSIQILTNSENTDIHTNTCQYSYSSSTGTFVHNIDVGMNSGISTSMYGSNGHWYSCSHEKVNVCMYTGIRIRICMSNPICTNMCMHEC